MGEKKLEQRIEELRVKAEKLMDDIKDFQKEMIRLQEQLDKKHKPPK